MKDERRRSFEEVGGRFGLSLVEGEIVKGFDVGLVLVRAGHGSLLKLLKWSYRRKNFRRVSAASEQRTQELDEIPVALLESEARRASEI